MFKKITYPWLTDKCICFLLILSMLSVVKTEIAGFPVYSLLLLLTALVWLAFKILYAGREGVPFLTVRYPTDTVSIAALSYAIVSVVVKLFDTSGEGWIDFSWNAELIALAVVCLLISSGVRFKMFYLDLLLYCGLLMAGLYLQNNLADGRLGGAAADFFADSAQTASYFLLVSMISVYGYVVCRDKMRSAFCMMVSGVCFFALFLNQNAVSIWLMGIYFLLIPIVLRPTAMLVKRAMQLFFMYLFMLSNMSLLTEYTTVFRAEISYSLEHSVYLELALAVGGLIFFHYWDRIPEGVDLERLVLKKMQRGYQAVTAAAFFLFAAAILGGEWATLPEGMAYDMVKSFVVPLAEAARSNESGILQCFRGFGVFMGSVLLISITLFLGRLRRNYAPDKPLTSILVLFSVIFLIQLFFWNPGIHNTVCYFYLLLTASFYKEERIQIESVGVNRLNLELQIQEIQM